MQRNGAIRDFAGKVGDGRRLRPAEAGGPQRDLGEGQHRRRGQGFGEQLQESPVDRRRGSPGQLLIRDRAHQRGEAVVERISKLEWAHSLDHPSHGRIAARDQAGAADDVRKGDLGAQANSDMN